MVNGWMKQAAQNAEELIKIQNIPDGGQSEIVYMPAGADRLAQTKADCVVVAAHNQAHIDFLLSGIAGEDAAIPEGSCTLSGLNAKMAQLGYQPVGGRDIKGRIGAGVDQEGVHGDTLLRQTIERIRSQADGTADSVVLVRAYRKQEKQEPADNEKRPFLTVLTRTQGKRVQELREVALCLSAQTCRDFEWLVIGHKPSAEAEAQLRVLFSEMPEYMRERTRFETVYTGTRTTPLNYGFDHARGAYVSILDDDDLVMDDWVEQFYNAARKTPGRMLHAYCVAQNWERVQNGEVLRASGSPEPTFCKPFDWYSQFRTNVCPLLSLAFPLYAHSQLGILFDETLNVTEDWDCIMRTASVTGVTDIPVVTSMYRLWNSDTSHDLHDEKVWTDSYNTIVKKFDSVPMMLPPHSGMVPRDHDMAVKELTLRAQVDWEPIPAEQYAQEENQFQVGTASAEQLRTRANMIVHTKSYRLLFPVRWLTYLFSVVLCGFLNFCGRAAGAVSRRMTAFMERIAPKPISIERADSVQLRQFVNKYYQSICYRAVRKLNRLLHR